MTGEVGSTALSASINGPFLLRAGLENLEGIEWCYMRRENR
jgi:NAD kinase